MAVTPNLVASVYDEPFAWGYLYGTLLSDGHTHKYGILLRVTDKEFAERFAASVKCVTEVALPVRPKPPTKGGRLPTWMVRLDSRFFATIIQANATPGSFTWRIPEWILTGTTEAKRGFLNAFLDGDGWVTSAGRNTKPIIGFRSVNLRGLEQLNQLLCDFGISHARLVTPRPGRAGSLILDRIADVRIYLDKIGISLQRKRQAAIEWLQFFDAHKRRDGAWTEEELVAVKDSYASLRADGLAATLNRSRSGIKQKAYDLGVKWKRPWTPEDLTYMSDHRSDRIADIAKALSRTPEAVGRKMGYMGINKRKASPPWTQADDRVILDHPDWKNKDIARALGRTVRATAARKSTLLHNKSQIGVSFKKLRSSAS